MKTVCSKKEQFTHCLPLTAPPKSHKRVWQPASWFFTTGGQAAVSHCRC